MTKIMFLFLFALLISACTGPVSDNSPISSSTQVVPSKQITEVLPTPFGTQALATETAVGTAQATELEFTEPMLTEAPFTETKTSENVTVLPDPAMLTWRIVADRLQKPVGLFYAGDGTGRLFIIEQPGRILILQEEGLIPDAFLDIRDRVGSHGFEQGLLGLAFHPQYAHNGLYFINYTDLQGDTVIARFSVDPGDPQRTDPATEKILLRVSQPYANHNGGMLAFGPDGYLYVGLGDGGSAGDPHGNGQSLDSLLGKILRLDIDQGDAYTIPVDNPYLQGEGLPEIWAYGLRNPWRFSFDALNGDLYIADVGQNQWEEINYLPASDQAGKNFGWNFFEANMPYSGEASDPESMVFPVFEYSHEDGCSVTGGMVYRGNQILELNGVYLFGDYCSGNVWGLVRDSDSSWQGELLFKNQGSITSFGEDSQGEIYMLLYSGQILRLEKK